jgi:hypothetical protein
MRFLLSFVILAPLTAHHATNKSTVHKSMHHANHTHPSSFILQPSQAPDPIPIAEDAYLQWDKWPMQRIGVRAYMRSTYDRRGGNEAADASHFLYQLADDNNVVHDIEGAGILYFHRTNHWHGSPWRYTFDGKEYIVQETSTADPNKPVAGSVFMPENLFPNPLTWTWSITKGADLNWVPMPFEKSFRLGYSRTHYGTGYSIWHQFVPGTKLSHPLKAWDGKTPPDSRVLDLLKKAGTNLLPDRASREARDAGLITASGVKSPPNTNVIFAMSGKWVIRSIELTVPKSLASEMRKLRIQITWDGRQEPSVDVPLPLFFGAGTLYNRDGRDYLVKALPSWIRYERDEIRLACFWPMPFFKSARIALIGPYFGASSSVKARVTYEPFKGDPAQSSYFHATYRDHPKPERGKDLVLLDTRGIEGSQDWTGSFVGTSWIFSHSANLGTLEGDPRFFFDDSESPQAYGTGTEEWGGGGDYWGGLNMTLPLAGHPVGAKDLKSAQNDEDKIESAYRFLLADLMPFGKNARIHLEHGGTNESAEHYETVTYWYGLPGRSLVKTDTLQIGDAASRNAHRWYVSHESPLYQVSSRYELGVDKLNGKEIYPEHTETGALVTVESEFTLKLDPANLGAMLRRKLDYQYPNQRAEVYIADDDEPKPTLVKGKVSDVTVRKPPKSAFKRAGTWYLAGSNTCVYSNPREELGATQHVVQTSNRRFRDDEFLLPLELTKGRKAIRVKIKFTPVNRPLFPGQPVPSQAWSEIRYDAYCFVAPRFPN